MLLGAALGKKAEEELDSEDEGEEGDGGVDGDGEGVLEAEEGVQPAPGVGPGGGPTLKKGSILLITAGALEMYLVNAYGCGGVHSPLHSCTATPPPHHRDALHPVLFPSPLPPRRGAGEGGAPALLRAPALQADHGGGGGAQEGEGGAVQGRAGGQVDGEPGTGVEVGAGPDTRLYGNPSFWL